MLRSLPSALLPSVFFVLLASACRGPASPALATHAGCHPACPGARAGTIADAGSILRGDPPLPAAPETAARAPSTAPYLCPMHPWIGADRPGRCSECGMHLVERAQVLEHDHGD